MNEAQIKDIIKASAALKLNLLEDENLMSQVKHSIEVIIKVLEKGGSIHLCGNGGSAADALHIAAEFSGRFYLNRKAMPVEALNVNEAALTAISNDFGFENLFARLLESKGKTGDLLWVMSTSGKSPNIIKVLEKAKAMNLETLTFCGKDVSSIAKLSDLVVAIPSEVTPRIQECHLLLGHIICELVEKKMFNE